MNFELFIAKRIVATKLYKNSVSGPIVKIATIAIATGIVVMLVSVATGIGLQRKIRDKVTGFKGHVQISNFDNNLSETTQTPISINQDFYPEFKSVKGVKDIYIYASKGGIATTEKDFEGLVFKGVTAHYNWSFFNSHLVAGRIPQFSEKTSNEVLISATLASRLQLQLKDKLRVYFFKEDPSKLPNKRIFTITGVYESGFQEFDALYVLGDLRHLQKINKWGSDKVGGFEVLLDDFDAITQKGSEIYNNIGPMLDSKTIVELFPNIFEWIHLFDSNIIVILSIMILIAGINMITALLVLILERTQMIGVLKALGSSNWQIRKIFLYNAAYLLVRGLFFGNLIGLSILFAQQQFEWISLDPETYYVSTVPVYLSFWHVLVLNAGTLVLCVMMLLLPSYMVTKISPARAVRFG